jgi:hypothetical protein
MHSTAQTAPAASEIFNETVSTGDAWIRQRKQPLRPQKSSPKVLPRGTHGFEAQTVLGFQKASTKLLLRVMHGLDISNSPCGHRNH